MSQLVGRVSGFIFVPPFSSDFFSLVFFAGFFVPSHPLPTPPVSLPPSNPASPRLPASSRTRRRTQIPDLTPPPHALSILLLKTSPSPPFVFSRAGAVEAESFHFPLWQVCAAACGAFVFSRADVVEAEAFDFPACYGWVILVLL